MDDKVLVNIIVPILEKKYEIFLPVSKTVGETIILVSKALVELSNGHYNYQNKEKLYNKVSGVQYNLSDIIKNTDIRNGTDLIFI